MMPPMTAMSELLRTPCMRTSGISLPRTPVNKGMKKDRSYEMPRSSRFIRKLGAYDDNTRLVDQAEGDDALVSTRFEAYLAPHTRVLARAAGDGIYAIS